MQTQSTRQLGARGLASQPANRGLTRREWRRYRMNSEAYLPMNGILADVPPEELRSLAAVLEPLWVIPGETLDDGGLLGAWCYFPVNAVTRTIATLEDGRTVGVGFAGREGMLGVRNLLGFRTHFFVTEVQVPGLCFRVPTETLRARFRCCEALRDRLLQYFALIYSHACQSIACNRAHVLHQRLCRWLLELRDRVESDELSVTHEALSQLLGATRADTSRAAGKLRELNLLRLRHGKLTILDRFGLETIACECYGAGKKATVGSAQDAQARPGSSGLCLYGKTLQQVDNQGKSIKTAVGLLGRGDAPASLRA